MNEAIVTGASGFIGSRVVLKLLKDQWLIHALGRRSNGTAWPERLQAALADIGDQAVSERLQARLCCHEASLTQPGLGMDPARCGLSGRSQAVLFHVAGDTRFHAPEPRLQRAINVEAPLHILRTFHKSLRLVVHISTAYVAGDRQGIVKEDEFDVGQAFHNSYEESKLAGELAVRELCAELNLPLAIIRPSIITNDTETGRSSTFTHLNALVEVITRIQEHYGLHDGEVVSKQIRVLIDPDARPNLAPVDPIVDALIKIMQHPEAPGKTYHLCHPSPQPNVEIIGLLMDALGVRQKVALSYQRELAKPVSYTERMIARSFRAYAPYLCSRKTFDLTNTRSLVPCYDCMFTPVELDYVRKVIAFQRITRMKGPEA